MGMLKLVFMTFLEFSLGYAMGATTKTLPAWPTWDDMEGHFGPSPSPPPGSGALGHPVTPLYISGYSWLSHPTHKATDFGLNKGQGVFAAHDGIVGEAGWSNVGYGLNVTLSSGEWWTRYAHLETVLVNHNQRVRRGELIGYGDDTGASQGDHLHFEVKHRGAFVDPMNCF